MRLSGLERRLGAWRSSSLRADASAPACRFPRYVSLKTDRVNLREGPSKDHRTAWVFQRAGLPVEIIAEYETWRRIRDSEGTEGWVLHSLLSGRRTALVMPWAKGKQPPIGLLDRTDDKGGVVAHLQPGVITNIKGCDGSWCRVMIVDGRRPRRGRLHPPGEAVGRLSQREGRVGLDARLGPEVLLRFVKQLPG